MQESVRRVKSSPNVGISRASMEKPTAAAERRPKSGVASLSQSLANGSPVKPKGTRRSSTSLSNEQPQRGREQGRSGTRKRSLSTSSRKSDMGTSSATADAIKVAVRCRPMTSRELSLGGEINVRMEDQCTIVTNPATGVPKSFKFDNCFWSADVGDADYADQPQVFSQLGMTLLESAWEGYNVCLLAYGQTGSGKTYTMMGSDLQNDAEVGIIPRLCRQLFRQIEDVQQKDPSAMLKVEACMMEIYFEQVRDLFNPDFSETSSTAALKIREDPLTGPYVQDLSMLAVPTYAALEQLLVEGAATRTISSTAMNAVSSRAHTIFQLVFSQTYGGQSSQKVSKINLVDLAGSERAGSSTLGLHFKQGTSINKSLSALGNCILALVEQTKHVPYRDSALTWLLKESLGGNAKTLMIGTISPSDIDYEETVSTLRYVERVKFIENYAVVNTDQSQKSIYVLEKEIARLKTQLRTEKHYAAVATSLKEQVSEWERRMHFLNQSWEEKLQQTSQVNAMREKFLGNIRTSQHADSPCLVMLNEDPVMSGRLLYPLAPGRTRFGLSSITDSEESDGSADVVLQGLNVADRHCDIIYDVDSHQPVLEVIDGEHTYLNGEQLALGSKSDLHSGDRLVIGHNYFFRVHLPLDPAKRQLALQASGPEAEPAVLDWEFAIKELVLKHNIQSTREVQLQQEIDDQNRALEDERCANEKRILELKRQHQLAQKKLEQQLSAVRSEESPHKNQADDSLSRKEQELKAYIEKKEMLLVEQQEQQKLEFELQQQLLEKENAELTAQLTMQHANNRVKRHADSHVLMAQMVRLLSLLREADVMRKELSSPILFDVCLLNRCEVAADGRVVPSESEQQVVMRGTYPSGSNWVCGFVWSCDQFASQLDRMLSLVQQRKNSSDDSAALKRENTVSPNQQAKRKIERKGSSSNLLKSPPPSPARRHSSDAKRAASLERKGSGSLLSSPPNPPAADVPLTNDGLHDPFFLELGERGGDAEASRTLLEAAEQRLLKIEREYLKLHEQNQKAQLQIAALKAGDGVQQDEIQLFQLAEKLVERSESETTKDMRANQLHAQNVTLLKQIQQLQSALDNETAILEAADDGESESVASLKERLRLIRETSLSNVQNELSLPQQNSSSGDYNSLTMAKLVRSLQSSLGSATMDEMSANETAMLQELMETRARAATLDVENRQLRTRAAAASAAAAKTPALTQEVAKLQGTVDALQAENTKISDNLKKLLLRFNGSGQPVDVETAIAQLDRMPLQKRPSIRDMVQTIETTVQQSSLAQDAADLRQKIAQLKKQQAETALEYEEKESALKQQADEAAKRADECQQALAEAKERCDAAVKKARADVKQHVNQLQQQLEAAEKAHRRTQETLNDSLASLKKRLSSTTKELEDLKAEAVEAKAIQDRLKLVRMDSGAKLKQIVGQSKELQQKDAQIQELQNRVSELSWHLENKSQPVQVIAAAREDAKVEETKIQILDETIRLLEDELAVAKASCTALTSKVAAQESEITELRSKQKSLNAVLKRKEMQLIEASSKRLANGRKSPERPDTGRRSSSVGRRRPKPIDGDTEDDDPREELVNDLSRRLQSAVAEANRKALEVVRVTQNTSTQLEESDSEKVDLRRRIAVLEAELCAVNGGNLLEPSEEIQQVIAQLEHAVKAVYHTKVQAAEARIGKLQAYLHDILHQVDLEKEEANAVIVNLKHRINTMSPASAASLSVPSTPPRPPQNLARQLSLAPEQQQSAEADKQLRVSTNASTAASTPPKTLPTSAVTTPKTMPTSAATTPLSAGKWDGDGGGWFAAASDAENRELKQKLEEERQIIADLREKLEKSRVGQQPQGAGSRTKSPSSRKSPGPTNGSGNDRAHTAGIASNGAGNDTSRGPASRPSEADRQIKSLRTQLHARESDLNTQKKMMEAQAHTMQTTAGQLSSSLASGVEVLLDLRKLIAATPGDIQAQRVQVLTLVQSLHTVLDDSSRHVDTLVAHSSNTAPASATPTTTPTHQGQVTPNRGGGGSPNAIASMKKAIAPSAGGELVHPLQVQLSAERAKTASLETQLQRLKKNERSSTALMSQIRELQAQLKDSEEANAAKSDIAKAQQAGLAARWKAAKTANEDLQKSHDALQAQVTQLMAQCATTQQQLVTSQQRLGKERASESLQIDALRRSLEQAELRVEELETELRKHVARRGSEASQASDIQEQVAKTEAAELQVFELSLQVFELQKQLDAMTRAQQQAQRG